MTITAAIVLFFLARAHEVSQLDQRVNEQARLLISLIEINGDSIELEFEDIDLRLFENPQMGWYLAVWIDDIAIYVSGSFEDRKPSLPSDEDISRDVRWVDLPTADSGRGMMIEITTETDAAPGNRQSSFGRQIDAQLGNDAPSVTVFIACDASDVLAACRALAIALFIVTTLTVLILAAILTLVVHRSMTPLIQVAARIKLIDASDLDVNVESSSLPTEIEPIVVQFNALLGRLKDAFERERSFCADVAHELRTPLSGLRTTLEVTQAKPRTPQEYANTVDQCQTIVIQTQRLVETLLQLAKLEADQLTFTPSSVDIGTQLKSLWQELTDKASIDKTYQIRWDLDPTTQAWTDPIISAIVFRNLLENALDYVDHDGVIEIQSVMSDGGMRLTISNSGSLVDKKDVEKVFHRFWRGIESRSGTGIHFGLGLSLAQRACENLGGALSVDAELNGIFRVIFLLPQQSLSCRTLATP